MKMNQLFCQFYPFMKAVRGNWRNAIFVHCTSPSPNCPSDGFLLAADADGKPLMISVKTMRHLTRESIEPVECCAILERRSIEIIFASYLEWHTTSDTLCPLCQFCRGTDIKGIN